MENNFRENFFLGISYAFGSVMLLGSFGVWAKARTNLKTLHQIEDQGRAYSVEDLCELKKKDPESRVLRAKRDVLISGLLVRKNYGDKDDNEEQARKHLYKTLGKALKDNKKLIKGEAHQDIEGPFAFQTVALQGHQISKNCVLIDPQGCKNLRNALTVRKEDDELDAFFNVKQKRKMPNVLDQTTHLIKYAALEGSTLSLIGLVQYDIKKDELQMLELYNVLAGGIDEAKRCLAERAELLRQLSITLALIGVCSIGVAGFFHYLRHRARRQRAAIENYEHQMRASAEQAQPVQEGGSTCIVCLENAATQVFVPCGHLLACGPCASVLEKKKDACPLCRREVQYDRNFVFKIANANSA